MPHTVGFAIVKPAEVLGAEPYMHELITGIERVLVPAGDSVLVCVVPSRSDLAATIRRWARDGAVDGVILIDLAPRDPLIAVVHDLGLPAVVSGDPETADGLSSVWSQDDVVMESAVRSMVSLGHKSIGHITGPPEMAHTILRARTFDECVLATGVAGSRAVGDYSERSGFDAARALLSGASLPTALIADNDLMAIGARAAAAELQLNVPDDVSILAWDDSALCQLSTPPLSAMSHDVQTVGELIGHTVREAMAGAPHTVVRPPAAAFVARGSTSRPLSKINNLSY